MNLNITELEEIMNIQRQGRRLSNMQMQSLNEFVQRRLSMTPAAGGIGRGGGAEGNRQDLASSSQHLSSQQRLTTMPSPRSSNGPILDASSQQQMLQYPASNFLNDPSYGYPYNAEMYRRDSLGFVHNILEELGYNSNNVDGSERRPSCMEKRNSLDLLGEAAVALSGNNDSSQNSGARSTSTAMDPSTSSYMPNLPASLQNHYQQQQQQQQHQSMRRSSLDFLLGGDPSLGRRNSLTQFLIQEFANPSRRSSMLSTIAMTKPIDPYFMDNLFDDPSNSNHSAGFTSCLPFPGSHQSYSNSDLFGMQFLQQPMQASSTDTYANNVMRDGNNNIVEDYMNLQNQFQNSFRNPLDDFPMAQGHPPKQSTPQSQQMQQLQQSISMPINTSTCESGLHSNNELTKIIPGQDAYWQKSKKKQVPVRHKTKTEPDMIPFDPTELPPFTLERMYSFKASMEKSSQTQTEIQLWDKKMGLKRSHSATMTKTTRSRKKLRKMLEKHLDFVLAKSKVDNNPKRTNTTGQ